MAGNIQPKALPVTKDAAPAVSEVVKSVEAELMYSAIVAKGKSIQINRKLKREGERVDLSKEDFDWFTSKGFVIPA